MNINYYFVRIETLGCRLNQVESEALAEVFLKAGFSLYNHADIPASDESVCLCVLNTCTVTGKAEQKARRIIRLLLRQHSNAVILVTGCYAQLEAAVIESIDHRVLAFPGRLKDRLIHLPAVVSEQVLAGYGDNSVFITQMKAEIRGRLQNTAITPLPLFALSARTFAFHSRATLKVQDGCNHACSFCRIRLARGKSVSLPISEVVQRAQEIEAHGAAEIVLSGVNLSQYSSGENGFAGLLEQLLEKTAQVQFRISSLYPEAVTPSLVTILANPRVCPHFHLSVQSGSDRILAAMRRPYTSDRIYNAVENLRRSKADPFIGCDVITGFPGETDADFECTYKMCALLQFSGIHAFPFSPRPGTAAITMRPKIPERIAGERAERLHQLAAKQYQAYLARWQGKTVRAVVEQALPNGVLKVLTENYLSLLLETEVGGQYHRGSAVTVMIKGSTAVLPSVCILSR